MKLDLKGFLGYFEILSAEVKTCLPGFNLSRKCLTCPILPVSTSLVWRELSLCLMNLYTVLDSLETKKTFEDVFYGILPNKLY